MSIIRSVSDISIIGIIRVMGRRVFITPIILILLITPINFVTVVTLLQGCNKL